MEEAEKVTFEMTIDTIKTINFSQSNLDLENGKKPLVEFETGLQFRDISEESKLGCLLEIKVLLPELKEVFAELKIEVKFSINPYREVVIDKGDSKFGIANSLMHTIGSIVISSARGILFEKLRGTALQNEIFPLVNPAELFNDNKQ